jgi:hypothetical protein
MMALHKRSPNNCAASLLLVLWLPVANVTLAAPGTQRRFAGSLSNAQEVPPPNFAEAARNPHFQAAIKEIAALLGSPASTFELRREGGLISGWCQFAVPKK